MPNRVHTPASFRAQLDEATGYSENVRAGFGNIRFSRGISIVNGASESDEAREPEEIEFNEVEEAFSAIKDGIRTPEQEQDLRNRVALAVARANEARNIGQLGYSERVLELAAGWILEQQAAALGYSRWVERELVHRVLQRTNQLLNIELCRLDQFPRAIPASVQEIIRTTRPIFTDFVIVFTNPKKETVKRDPILFGVIRSFEDRLYYITDWIDEYCDLTMDKLMTIGQQELHDDWRVQTVPSEPTDEDMRLLIDRVLNKNMMPVKHSFLKRFRAWLRYLVFGME